MLARRYVISGDVQGVGFRYFVLREAQRIGGITGFVRNLRDGRVEVVAQADEHQLQQLERLLHKGPGGSSVSQVNSSEESASDRFQDFRITF